jgi:hypothetical protein
MRAKFWPGSVEGRDLLGGRGVRGTGTGHRCKRRVLWGGGGTKGNISRKESDNAQTDGRRKSLWHQNSYTLLLLHFNEFIKSHNQLVLRFKPGRGRRIFKDD